MQGPIPLTASRSGTSRDALHLLAAAVAAALALGVGNVAAADDPNPYYIGLNEAITHDSNIGRVAGGVSDTYSSSGLVGGVDQPIGRQRVYGNGNITLNRYRSQTGLNNTSYALSAGLDWQTIDRLSGSVYTRFTRGLASLSNNLLQATEGSNVVRSEQVGTRISWGGNAAITVQGGYGHNKTSYSAPSYQAGDSTDDSADIGVYYQPGQTLTLGSALRYTRSNADRALLLADGSSVGNRTSGRNVDLSVSWRPTAQSGANARVSWTNQSSSVPGGTGFSGLTGALGFTYMPTGKLSFSGQLSRDASTNGNFYNTFNGTTNQPTVGLAANSTVSNSASLGAGYSATAKVSVNASLQYTRSTQDQTGAANSAFTAYSDHLTTESIGASWSIRRYWSAGCNLGHVRRRLTGSFANDYSATSYSCFTQVTLQ